MHSSVSANRGLRFIRFLAVMGLGFLTSVALARMGGAGGAALFALGAPPNAGTVVLSHPQAQQLIAASPEQRPAAIETVVDLLYGSLNRRTGTGGISAAVLSRMLNTLLEQGVPSYAFPAAFSVQTDDYGVLIEQLALLSAAGNEWRNGFQAVLTAVKTGRFDEAGQQLSVISAEVQRTSNTGSFDRLRIREVVAGVEGAGGWLAKIRLLHGDAGAAFERASTLFGDENGIEAANWLHLSAFSAVVGSSRPRAIELLERLAGMASGQIGRATAFPDWFNFQWWSHAQLALMKVSDGKGDDALLHFRAMQDTESALSDSYAREPTRKLLSLSVVIHIVEWQLQQGDVAGAKRIYDQGARLDDVMKDRPEASLQWDVLRWKREYISAELARLQSQPGTALRWFRAASETARELATRHPGEAFLLEVLLNSLVAFERLPGKTVPDMAHLSLASERVAVARQRVQLDPRSTEAQVALWEAYSALVALQLRLAKTEELGGVAKSAAALAQRMVDEAPADAQRWQRLYRSHAQLADVQLAANDIVGAIEHLETAISAAGRRVDLDPDNDDAHADLWKGLTDMGDAKLQAGNRNGALTQHLLARNAALDRLSKEGADSVRLDRIQLSYSRIGDVYEVLGDLGEEASHYAEAAAYSRRFELQATTPRAWRRGHWYALSQWGRALAKQRQLDRALVLQTEAREYASLFLTSEGDRQEVDEALWFSWRETGGTLIAQGDLSGGLHNHRTAESIAVQQLARDPESAIWRSYVHTSHEELEQLGKR
ncbi:hypothetical protein [Hydrogenophaga sp. PAMC20947]|uniref:hypothetical protein n=1 Tax=Hydrogenophaga sp. PAMC20947 TaxID=2565558 RepID=UPI00109E2D99|nr:hypothetical protein [Hydrogenophaga sp. PAMC20947]QCB44756.1 hypothetical protein E5678_01080 [Hydrogenophaga sp. PAMC20947]